MKRRHSAALAALTLIGTPAFAHPPDALVTRPPRADRTTLRSWTNATTGQIETGAFLASRTIDGDTWISIERESGDIMMLPLDDLSDDDQAEARRRMQQVGALNQPLQFAARPDLPAPAPRDAAADKPPQAEPFDAFAPFVATRWDERWLYVESDGLPHKPGGPRDSFTYSHPLMVGITAWQQQVPLPQSYRGDNAWRIPLKPEPAEKPVSAKEQLFRGAIALAANGVPIFNPIKNDGKTDTLVAGELDDFGGHCGRADDYHYHIAPTHLQKFVGKDQPIAYALDGYPIYGFYDPAAKQGSEKACPLGSHDKLDALNGHTAEKGGYHYHATPKYPYLNGGMHGKVTVKEDQIDPQPHASPVRDWLQPLRGAKITGFKATGKESERAWSLEYAVNGKPGFVNFRIDGEGRDAKYHFEFISPDGTKNAETYAPREQRRGGQRGRGDDKPGEDRPRREGRGGQRGGEGEPPRRAESPPKSNAPAFALTSTDVTDGRLNVDCTCDGKSRMPTLKWDKPPAGTKAFAAVMHHITPDDSTRVYFVVANIPATARELKSGDDRAGVWGQNSVNRRNEYAPPCSQGPGDKTYIITLYALSAEAKLPDGPALTRDTLLSAIKDKTLATTTLEVTYARKQDGDAPQDKPRNPDGRKEGRGGGGGPPPEQSDDSRSGLLERMYTFKTDVPAHDVDVILARPTDRSITVSVATAAPAKAIVEFWPESSSSKRKAEPVAAKPGDVAKIELPGLTPGATYRYRVGTIREGSSAPVWGDESHFRTKPPPGTPFTFTIQADSHLDQGVEPQVYEQTLANMLADKPDFVIDLGDTFMTDKRGRDFMKALPQYDAQRWYFSRVAHAAPLFMVLGNHDGEKGTSGRDADDIGPWSFRQRTARFPEPIIDGRMYTGATGIKDGVGSNYYAFEWGDALIIVLDPYWGTTERIRGGGRDGGGGGGGNRGSREARNAGDKSDSPREQRPAPDEQLKPIDSSWAASLGRPQYDWLTQTLSKTKAKYRFVFIHHLVGGFGGAESRGGAEASPFFEWGGKNADGSSGFAEHRPGWPLPIHDLLAKHKVAAVFHGHDHLYAREERDGVIYQCIAQPGNPAGNTRSAAQYGYKAPKILGSPGYLRVRISASESSVEFIRTALNSEAPDRKNSRQATDENAEVMDRYAIRPITGK